MNWILPILLLLLPSSFVAWRYSLIPVDPDFALFNLAAFTGSWYGRDFADCKTPTIHVWFYILAKIVGKNVRRVRFTHHFIVGFGGGVLVLWLTGDFWKALAFTTLVNAGWLFAFHGNVGQVPALFMVVALLVEQPWIAATAALVALAFEPKLLPSYIALVFIEGWYIPTVVWGGIGLIIWLLIRKTQVWMWMWESSVTIPRRMSKMRNTVWQYPWAPWYTSIVFLYFLPWVIVGVWSTPSITFWLPAALYLILASTGKVIRNNHLLPLVAWAALALDNPSWVIALVAIDWLASGLYLNDIWGRFYPALGPYCYDTRAAGEWLKDKAGSVWANGIYSACVYLYSEKPVPYGITENIEIREVSEKRIKSMRDRFNKRPVDWVVETGDPLVPFAKRGYLHKAKGATFDIWRKA